MNARAWTPQPMPVLCERDERGKWMPAPEPVQLTFLPPVIRDVWSQDPDRTTRRGTC